MFVTSLPCLFTQLHLICTTEDLTNEMGILWIWLHTDNSKLKNNMVNISWIVVNVWESSSEGYKWWSPEKTSVLPQQESFYSDMHVYWERVGAHSSAPTRRLGRVGRSEATTGVAASQTRCSCWSPLDQMSRWGWWLGGRRSRPVNTAHALRSQTAGVRPEAAVQAVLTDSLFLWKGTPLSK